MSYTNLVTIKDPTELLLKGAEVQRTFEKEWLIRLFAEHKDLPQSDVIQFLHTAQLTGANPILKQIYLISHNTKVKEYGQPERWEKRGTIIFSKDFVAAKAFSTNEVTGVESGTELAERFDPFSGQKKEELKAWATVKRNGITYKHHVWWSSYGKDNNTWRRDPEGMLEKCALVGCYRKAFPEVLGNMYTPDEISEEDLDKLAEERMKAEAIEVQATKTIEKAEELKAKLESPELVDKIEATIKLISDEMGALTKGMDLGGKGKAMSEHLGVNRFADLKTKSLEELEMKLRNIQAINEEKISRSQKVADINAGATSEVKNEAQTPEVEPKTKTTSRKPPQEKPTFTI